VIDFKLDRKVSLATAGLGLLAFFIYLRTLYPTLGGGDSGEFIGTVCEGGIPHPPGFPLYMILVRLFALIPVGETVWRVNAFSAICSALSASMLLIFVKKWTGSLASGIVAGSLFAFSPLVWTYATTAEVFALNHLLVILILLFTLSSQTSRATQVRLRSIHWICFLLGLAASNHQISLFFSIPFVSYSIYINYRIIVNPRRFFFLCFICLLVGLSPYLYLPITSWFRPSGNHLQTFWGETGTWLGFWRHIFRTEYGILKLFADPVNTAPSAVPNFPTNFSGTFETLGLYFSHIPEELLYLGVPLVFLGLGMSLFETKARSFNRTLLFSFVLFVCLFHFLAKADYKDPIPRIMLSRFWMQPNLVLFAWCGYGFSVIQKKIEDFKIHKFWIYFMMGFFLYFQIEVNFKSHDQSKNFVFEEYGKTVLDSFLPHSLALTQGDVPDNAILYLQKCKNYKTDELVLQQELLSYSIWYQLRIRFEVPEVRTSFPLSLGRFIEENTEKYAIYGVPSIDPTLLSTNHYIGIPNGFAQRIYVKPTQLPLTELLAQGQTLIEHRNFFGDLYRSSPLQWEHFVWLQWVDSIDAVGVRLLQAGLLQESAAYYEKCTELAPQLPEQIYGNQGLVNFMLYEKTKNQTFRSKSIQALNHYLKTVDPALPNSIKAKTMLQALTSSP